MTNNLSTKPTALFWVAAVIFILWNIMGCSIYLMEMMMSDEAYADAFGAEMAAVRDVYPTWGLAGYATAVWSGLLAAILFILRKRVSVLIFMLSVVAAAISFIPSFTNSMLREAAGSSFWVMPVIVIVIGLFEIFYSRRQQANGILS